MPAVLSLFDLTGNVVAPWLDAGFVCYIVDLQHTPGEHREGNLVRVGADIRYWLPPRSVDFHVAFAFPPCDHLAVSGNRWKKDKGLGALAQAIELVAHAVKILEWLEAPYLLEQPISSLSTYWRAPDHYFHPADFTTYEPRDNYTKKTCAYTGYGFVMPQPDRDTSLPAPDDRIHKAPPGPDRANFRSATPLGFARAVFNANRPLA